MKHLDDNIKLTSMSIPGYVCSENTTGAEITKLLDMGIRAFDMGEIFKGEKNNDWGSMFTEWSGQRLCTLPDDISTALKTFFQNSKHSSEFVIIWLNDDLVGPKRWAANIGTTWEKWKGTLLSTTTLGESRNNIIAIRKRNQDFIPEDNRDEHLFGFTTDNFTISTEVPWGVQFINNNTSGIYASITHTEVQRGYTGIVTLPIDVNATDNGAFTDDEKLIQAIIDCNYKFILDRKLNQP